MTRKLSGRTRRPMWRRLLKLAVILALLLVTLVAIFLLWNRIDRAPSSDALRFATAPPLKQVADADNAWLLLAGIDAAEGDDPIALGRLRVNDHQVRAAGSPTPSPGGDAANLMSEPNPAVGPEAGIAQFYLRCSFGTVNCLSWASKNRSMLGYMRELHELRLQRFESMHAMPGWQSLALPLVGESDGLIESETPELFWNMVTLNLMGRPSAGDGASETSRLAEVARSVAFWQGVRSTPQDLQTILLSGQQIDRAYWLVNDWLDLLVADWMDRAVKDELAVEREALEQILAPPGSAPDWSLALHHRYMAFDLTVSSQMPGVGAALQQCISGSAEGQCFNNLLVNATHTRQATLNQVADYLAAMQRLLDASPTEIETVRSEVSPAMQAQFPDFENVGPLLGQLSYNFGGRILSAISIPAFDWSRREHDREALRRMLWLKYEAIRQSIDSTGMEAFLDEQSETLSNPLSGEPFTIDPLQQTIHFAVSAPTYWGRPRLDVRLPTPSAARISVCEQAFAVDISQWTDGALDGESMAVASCGEGGDAWRMNDEDADESAYGRLPLIELRRIGNEIGLHARLDVARQALGFRGNFTIEQAEAGIRLSPIVKDDADIDLVIRLLPELPLSMLRLNVVNEPADTLMRDIAAAKGLQIKGDQLVGGERVTLRFEAETAAMLEFIVENDGLLVRQTGPDAFELYRPDR